MRSCAKAVGFAVGVSLLAAVFTTSSDANADTPTVDSSPKGIVGGALLGGEVGFLTLAATGTKSSTLYYTIPPLLAVGGGVAGYFVDKGEDAHPSTYLLAGGMALIGAGLALIDGRILTRLSGRPAPAGAPTPRIR